jgi:hypothetical protein
VRVQEAGVQGKDGLAAAIERRIDSHRASHLNKQKWKGRQRQVVVDCGLGSSIGSIA